MRPKPTKAETRAQQRVTKATSRQAKPLHEVYRPKARTIEIQPKNIAQADYLDALYDEERDIIFATGPAGTGKTYLPSLYAIRELKDAAYKRIIITRPVVPNGEDLGYLPGDIIEKMGPWVRPMLDAFMEVMGRQEIESMLDKGSLEISPLAYMRGRTFKNAIIIADEMQNATPEQMMMLLTRIGEGSRMVVTGDLQQWDREKIGNRSGLLDFIERLGGGPSRLRHRFSHIEFGVKDIERHPVISDVLELYDLDI